MHHITITLPPSPQNIRKDFIQNEVVNFELGMHLYGYLLQDEYAARIHDPRTYHYVSRDIVNRWMCPLVVDAHILLQDDTYSHAGSNIYKEKGVMIPRSSKVQTGVVIGSGTVCAVCYDLPSPLLLL